MNEIRVGPGDEATWGPVISGLDPRYVGRNFRADFHLTIGEGDALVNIVGDVEDDELQLETCSVWYVGIDIADVIEPATWLYIRDHFDRHIYEIAEVCA